MECPHCRQALPALVCVKCGGETPADSRFCSRCGTQVQAAEKKGGDDFSDRRLCSDGACIGVINEQGVCNICSKPYTGDPS
jgi:hypothetical protein